MGRQIIGISANDLQDSGEVLHHLPISYTPDGYVKAVQKAGGLPLVLPVGTKDLAQDYISQIDKLILTGGQDVLPKFYKQTKTVQGNYSEARDYFELALLEEALLQKKPVFAVCRGMQLMNVFFGGDLKQELSSFTKILHMQEPIPREQPTHQLLTKGSSILQEIYGEKASVNSFHNQALNRISSNLTETAFCPDGVIEAVENKDQRLLGVQWHPDFAFEAQPNEMKIFDYVVKSL
ncbi:gamma-glutamyl-gamma-aminobutyrate hydrolase [Tetragenococcus halophilus subsp. flandriensis]|uniref:gamma-glutamyl-gamma-aminobutyrate hydrolase family protein n=1 Tax=Tetragenococcus halophilus TaxID=51669 RepID=UPI0023E9D586|nr:gamma-glutamyl-gamma-aminobutyrate hydrolase family protein [Tetragenococcus halophilus]GMA07235.1 gamma-glutamyl-gamma-aminobutyrate hydrolase [Tetragenococcus halophilus subsp. flandriensis]